MNWNQDDSKRPGNSEPDMLAELIRTAGRREEPPAEDAERVFAAATAVLDAKIKHRRRRVLMGSVAAGIALTVSILTVVNNRPPQPTIPLAIMERVIGEAELRATEADQWSTLRDEDKPLYGASQLRTGRGSRVGVRLANGGSLRLAESTVVTLNAAEKIHLYAGKIYIDSGAGPSNRSQIQVITAAGTARDIGTQFEIQYVDDAYRLRVREGQVRLQGDSGQFNSLAGDQLSIESSGDIRHARIASDDPEWQWVQSIAPAPDIDEQPVTVLLDWVARETGRQVRFEQPMLEVNASSTILHGNIRNLSPLEALEVMLATTDFESVIMDDGTILIRSRD